MDERMAMSQREVDRLLVLRKVVDGRLTQVAAGEQVGRSPRQIRRLCARLVARGARGLIHGLRGRPSNHQLAPGLLDRAVALVRAKYPDFGPTLARETLAERHGLHLGLETLRQGLRRAGLWRGRRQDPPYRAWRTPRAACGELVQLDGSPHAWFEDRGPRCALVSYVDDATSKIPYAEFIPEETTRDLLRTTGAYLRRYGRPVAFYVDRDGIYRVNQRPTREEQLTGAGPRSQFHRAMQELGIELIFAQSPQAKGRVENRFGTLQDRLVKALRLARIRTLAAANAFLRQTFLPQFNARFAHAPASPTDAHRPLLPTHDLDAILSLRETRQVQQDFTLHYQGQRLQLAATQPVRIRPKMAVVVEARLDDSIHLWLKGRELAFTRLPAPRRRRGFQDLRRWPTVRDHAA